MEWLNGTNPNDPLSFVQVRIEARSGAVALRFTAQAGKAYQVQFSNSPDFNAFSILLDQPAEPLTREVELQDPPAHPGGFYRLVAFPAN